MYGLDTAPEALTAAHHPLAAPSHHAGHAELAEHAGHAGHAGGIFSSSNCIMMIPKMTSTIPTPLPVTYFPSLSTLFDAPSASSRPSSYREERSVRCRDLPGADCSADLGVVVHRFASFLLSLTGEDDVVFTLHQGKDRTAGQFGETDVAQHAVYATRRDRSDIANDPVTSHTCAATIIDQVVHEYVTTDFALVIGHAPSEALKVWHSATPSHGPCGLCERTNADFIPSLSRSSSTRIP